LRQRQQSGIRTSGGVRGTVLARSQPSVLCWCASPGWGPASPASRAARQWPSERPTTTSSISTSGEPLTPPCQRSYLIPAPRRATLAKVREADDCLLPLHRLAALNGWAAQPDEEARHLASLKAVRDFHNRVKAQAKVVSELKSLNANRFKVPQRQLACHTVSCCRMDLRGRAKPGSLSINLFVI
jgi:hypothetical protein